MINNPLVFLNLTTRCNIVCEKCWRRTYLHKAGDISKEMLANFFRVFNSYEGVILAGTGENSIAKPLDMFINWINTKKCRTVILTNAVRVHNNKPHYYSKKVKWGVTLDGFYQEDVDGLQHGLDIEKVKANIRNIKKIYPESRFYINYTLTCHNIKHLPDLIDFTRDMNIRDLYITPLKVYKDFNTVKMLPYYIDINQENIKTYLLELCEYARVQGIRMVLPKSKEVFNHCFMINKTSPVIDIDGSVSFCSGKEHIKIGYIDEGNIIEKWQTINQKIRANDQEPSWCKDCSNRDIVENGLYSIPYKDSNILPN